MNIKKEKIGNKIFITVTKKILWFFETKKIYSADKEYPQNYWN